MIEQTLAVFGRPLEELFDPSTVSLVSESLRAFQARLALGTDSPDVWGRLFAEGYDWQDGKSPFTAASLVQGFVQYAGFLTEDVNKGEIMEVLSSCYESVLSFAAIGRTITVEQERENPYVSGAVELQVTLIQEVCGLD
ncbi:hypothetical protein [Streptomyces aurantiogriseus]|uniref:hypothetical protein n=1 Tax=Streptomyces aurantiogriseus TaxID=66870 RepID=UPI0016749607|nr:hypothetical protein [Streptomyces aurantiogriseus]